MRVGLDARPALFSRTGIGRAARELFIALSARADMQVLGYGAAWRRPRAEAGLPGVRTPRIPARLQAALAPLGFGVETLLGPLDIFHHTDLVYAPVRRAREVMSLHDLTFLHGQGWHDAAFTERVEPRVRRAAARAAAIFVPCERVRDDVLARRVAPAERVHVVPLGCDHVDATRRSDDAAALSRLRARAGLPADAGPLVLLPGTREPRKNQLALLQAFVDLPRGTPGCLLFVGPRGWGCAELEATLAEGRRPAHVGVLGEVPEEELAVLLRGADVVAYPSLAEGFGLPVAEALHCGRAVLTTRATPMADYGGDAVLAVDGHDVGALRDGLRQLLGDATLRAALGAAGRRRVERLTWARAAEATHAIYQHVGGNVDSAR